MNLFKIFVILELVKKMAKRLFEDKKNDLIY